MSQPSLYRRFSTWGALAGVLTSLWMVIFPAVVGEGFWFWFEWTALLLDFDLKARALPPLAGYGIGWWLGVVALPPAGFALGWKALRARDVGLERELALARRRADHKAALEASEALWQAVEDAERADDPAARLAAIDAWMGHALEVELTAELRADRVERLRRMAREAADPDVAVRLLEQAQALSQTREGRSLTLWAALAPDLRRYGLGLVVGLALIPLLALPVGFVMWALNVLLASLAVGIILVIVLVLVFGS